MLQEKHTRRNQKLKTDFLSYKNTAKHYDSPITFLAIPHTIKLFCFTQINHAIPLTYVHYHLYSKAHLYFGFLIRSFISCL